ncbi:MAG: hypothetical protein NTW50_05160 [Candidatus Berkelbacteria bacterium]|nr:hypothetical protein [Candidatus Berkelbacteria bacterium]
MKLDCHTISENLLLISGYFRRFDGILAKNLPASSREIRELREIKAEILELVELSNPYREFEEKLADENMWQKFEEKMMGVLDRDSPNLLSGRRLFDFLGAELSESLPEMKFVEKLYIDLLDRLEQSSLHQKFSTFTSHYAPGYGLYAGRGFFFNLVNSVILEKMLEKSDEIIIGRDIPINFKNFFGVFLEKGKIEIGSVGDYAFASTGAVEAKIITAGDKLGMYKKAGRIEVRYCDEGLGEFATGGKFVAYQTSVNTGKNADAGASFVIDRCGVGMASFSKAAFCCDSGDFSTEFMKYAYATCYINQLRDEQIMGGSGATFLCGHLDPSKQFKHFGAFYQNESGEYVCHSDELVHRIVNYNALMHFIANRKGLAVIEDPDQFTEESLSYGMKGGILVLRKLPSRPRFSKLTLSQRARAINGGELFKLGIEMDGGILLIDDPVAKLEQVYAMIDQTRKGGLILMRVYNSDGTTDVVDVEEEMRKVSE